MYYLQSRYYNASVGRFINGDNPQNSASFFTNYEFNLYTYCQNSPTFDVDLDGQISFSKVKKAIKDVVDNIKNVFKNIVNYIKKKFQEFISKVSCHFNNGYAYIPTTPIAILIDAIINTIVGFFKGLLLKGGFNAIKLWFKSKSSSLLSFLKDTIVPLISNCSDLIESIVKYAIKRFKFKLVVEYTKTKISNMIFGSFEIYRWISAFSSVGSFVATVLDVLDGKWDDQLAV